jgi:peptidoglycan/xylan/chitin deacetylase (PgdA/CDA1 family)
MPVTSRLTSSFLLLAIFVLTAPVILAADSAAILLYHHVADDTPPSTSISPTDFRKHLSYLQSNDFNVISLDFMIDQLKSGQPLPEKSVAISFDDGYSSIYSEAFPLLQSYDYPFTVFLSTKPIDNQQANYMSWEQVREMANAGAIIANHMVDHPYMLERRDGENSKQWISRLRTDLILAEQRIESETGQSHRYLAYPYGEYNSEIKSLLAKLNFTGLAQNSGAVGINSDFLALPRFPLAGIYANLDTAKIKFSALPFKVSTLQPDSPVTSSRSPSVTLKFEPGNYHYSQISCFANNKALPMTWMDRDAGIVELKPQESYQGRRWRYICTAPDLDSNRYYWYSVQWINLD